MGAALPVISAVGSLLGGAATLKSAFGGGGKSKAPQISAPAVPAGPEADLTGFKRPDPMDAPAFLKMSSGMTPIQQRTAIATGALQGNSAYRDPASLSYYSNLAQRDLVGDSGELGDFSKVTPVERQFLTQVLGQSQNNPDTAGFLSAIIRGTRGAS